MKNLTPIPHKYLTQLHPTKNQDMPGIPPAELSAGSGKQVWWQCENNHENYRAPRDYIKANGCTQCQRENNLLSKTYPQLKAEWDTTKNTETFETISTGSNKKVWWKCLKCEYVYDSVVYHRTRTKRPTGCPNCAGKALIQGINDLATTHPDLVKQWHPTKNAKNPTPNQFRAGTHKKVWWLCEKGHEWEAEVRKRARLGQGCPKCVIGTQTSKTEIELYEYVKRLSPDAINNQRGIIKKELDIYIPSKNIAIEYNGLWWHREDCKGKEYHYNKWFSCNERGIQLIQIWEDDWNRNPELVKRMLAHKLGVTVESKLFAHKTKIKSLSQIEADQFLDQNHIQGAVQGSIRLGLVISDTQTRAGETKPLEHLVAVMVLENESESKTLNLLRFAITQPILGGFEKLLNRAEQTEKVTKIIVTTDNTISRGTQYVANGFILSEQLPVDYMYFYQNKREHKDSKKILANATRRIRIWDAGKTKWVKHVKPQ